MYMISLSIKLFYFLVFLLFINLFNKNKWEPYYINVKFETALYLTVVMVFYKSILNYIEIVVTLNEIRFLLFYLEKMDLVTRS